MKRVNRNDPCPCGSGKKYKSCCLITEIDEHQLKQIFDGLIANVRREPRIFSPPILDHNSLSWLPILTENYLMFAILSDTEMLRMTTLLGSGVNPFPGLISISSLGAAFGLDKSRNVLIQNCTVKNMITIALGKDCSIIVSNHLQSINTIEFGQYQYVVELAYIVSFGEEINRANMYEFLADLVSYSINEWRSNHGKETF